MSQELQTHIQTLHDLLEGQPVDECTAATVKQVTTEIQFSLAQAEGVIPDDAYKSVLEQEAIRFSEDHPAISQAIRQIINALGNMGI